MPNTEEPRPWVILREAPDRLRRCASGYAPPPKRYFAGGPHARSDGPPVERTEPLAIVVETDYAVPLVWGTARSRRYSMAGQPATLNVCAMSVALVIATGTLVACKSKPKPTAEAGPRSAATAPVTETMPPPAPSASRMNEFFRAAAQGRWFTINQMLHTVAPCGQTQS